MYKKSFVAGILIFLGILFSFSFLYWGYKNSFLVISENILYSILTGCVFAIPSGILALCYINPNRRIQKSVYKLRIALKDKFHVTSDKELEFLKKNIDLVNDIINEICSIRNNSYISHSDIIDEIVYDITRLSVSVNEHIKRTINEQEILDYSLFNSEIEQYREQCILNIEKYQNS